MLSWQKVDETEIIYKEQQEFLIWAGFPQSGPDIASSEAGFRSNENISLYTWLAHHAPRTTQNFWNASSERMTAYSPGVLIYPSWNVLKPVAGIQERYITWRLWRVSWYTATAGLKAITI